MRFWYLITVFLMLFPFLLNAQGREEPRFSLSFHSGLFPEFTLDGDQFSKSSILDLRAHFYDESITRLEYTMNYSRGYHPSVSYSYGLSAGYRFRLGDSGVLKTSFGIENYKMKDRECGFTIRTILNPVFNVDKSCSDDVHASFNPAVALEVNITAPVWVIFDVTYRAILSSIVLRKRDGSRNRPGRIGQGR